MEIFLKSVIEAHGDNLKEICQEIQPYHKYLECLLHEYSTKIREKIPYGAAQTKDEIDSFVKTYEEKLDKVYVLFLFRFYEYYEGIKSFSQQLHLNQELLGLYIDKNDHKQILQLCVEFGESERNLWITTLSYFWEKGEEDRIKECLGHIGSG